MTTTTAPTSVETAQELTREAEQRAEEAAAALTTAAAAADLAAVQWLTAALDAGNAGEPGLASEYRNRAGWMRTLAAKHRSTARSVRLGLA